MTPKERKSGTQNGRAKSASVFVRIRFHCGLIEISAGISMRNGD
jgi:hypothetical protein